MQRERSNNGHGMDRWCQVNSLNEVRYRGWSALTNRLNDKAKIEAMGIKPKDVMDLAISTISAMTFSWG